MPFRALALLLAMTAAPLAAQAEQIRLLAFGDSLTAGYGLNQADGLVPRLQAWLDARGHDVVVLNGGLSGDTTAGGRARIERSLARHDPDAVMVELGGNDLLYDLGVAGAEDNLDAVLTAATQGGRPVLLVGIAKPDRDEARRRSWAELWPRLAQRHGTLVYDNLYMPLFSLPQSELPRMMQGDGVHASAHGVRLVVEALGPQVEALLAQVQRKRQAAGG